MANTDLDPAGFGSAFKAFMEAMVAATVPTGSPLVERMQTHLGTDPTPLPVIGEEYDTFEHPNLQVALDAYLAAPGRQAELVGIGADNKRFMSFGLSDLLSRGGLPGRPLLTEGPVDYLNFHLAGGRILSCVQFGIYFIHDGATPLVAFVAGPSDQGGPRQKLRVEVLAPRPEEGQTFLADLTKAMRRLNVYRGLVISLSPASSVPDARR